MMSVNNSRGNVSECSSGRNSFLEEFRSALLNARVNAVNLRKVESSADEETVLANPKIVIMIQQGSSFTEDSDVLFCLSASTADYRLLARLSVAANMDLATLVKSINLVLAGEENVGVQLVLPPDRGTNHRRLATNFISVA